MVANQENQIKFQNSVPQNKKTDFNNIKASQESLKNSLLLRANKIFINQNNHCLIVDSEKIIEGIKNKNISPKNSLSQTINIKSSSLFNNNKSFTNDEKKLAKIENIIKDSSENQKDKINILDYTSLIERNDQWLREKIKKKEYLKKEKEEEEMKDCSFAPKFFTKSYKSSSNSRISTVMRNSESSPFSSHRSIISSRILNSNQKNDQHSFLQSLYDKLKIKGNNIKSKWYYHESYQKEFEKKREFSNKK